MDHPTDQPTGIQSSLFVLCLKHSSFIIHSSYLLTMIMNDDWPPDSVPSKGPTRSVRGSVTRRRRRKTGRRKWTLFFSALVCRLHNGGLYQDASVLRLVGGKEVVASGSGGRQASAKFQVSSTRGLEWF